MSDFSRRTKQGESLLADRREPPEWVVAMVAAALENARLCEREARRLRKTARLIADPPPGVRITYAGRGIVNIIGPEIKA